jgi:hypothetical protein
MAACLAAVLAVGAAAVGCSKSEPRFEELRGWERVDVWGHIDVVDFDRVAATTGPDGLAWFTRARGSTDTLAYWSSSDGESVSQVEVAMPDEPVVIPVSVANDATESWAAVAVSRERANGENTGLVAWQSGDSQPRPERLTPPERGLGVPARVETARIGDVAVVVGVVDGEAVAWRSTDGGRWRGDVLDLEVDDELVTTDLASDGERLVLAGVDRGGRGHLWTSTGGENWEPLAADLPSSVGSATLLGPVALGELLVSWLDDTRIAENGDDIATRAPSTTVQHIAGDRVSDEGTIEARPDDGWPDLSLSGATVGPNGRIVAVGSAWQGGTDGTPMVWVREADRWEPSAQPELVGRLDYELRAVTSAPGDRMVGLVTPASTGIDAEVWAWRPPG